MADLRPMATAPRDVPVLLRFKRDKFGGASGTPVDMWAGRWFVGISRGDAMEWSYAGPVGCGGFPDDWLEGWMPLPPEGVSPSVKAEPDYPTRHKLSDLLDQFREEVSCKTYNGWVRSREPDDIRREIDAEIERLTDAMSAPGELSLVDAQVWINNRAPIIEALATEGFQIVSSKDGVRLRRVGVAPSVAPSMGDHARWALAAFNKAKREQHADDYTAMGVALVAAGVALGATTEHEQTLVGLLKRCVRCLPPEHATRKLATDYLKQQGFFNVLRDDVKGVALPVKAEPSDDFVEAVSCFRKAAWERDHPEMMRWQLRIMELFRAGAAGVAVGDPASDDEARKWAWQQVREQVGTDGWTVGESADFFGFFCWGWRYRGQLEAQRTADVKVAHIDLEPPAEFIHEGERYRRKNNGQSVKVSDGSCWRFAPELEVARAADVTLPARVDPDGWARMVENLLELALLADDPAQLRKGVERAYAAVMAARSYGVKACDTDGWTAELMRLADRYAKATELWSHSLVGSPEDNKADMTRQKAECRAALLAQASGTRSVSGAYKDQQEADRG